MPHPKFRELAMFGRKNSINVKKANTAKNKEAMPRFVVPPAVKAMGVKIENPNEIGVLEKLVKPPALPDHAMFRKTRIQDHPLYKTDPTYLFDGTLSMAEGINQACSLVGALAPRPFPKGLIEEDKLNWKGSNLKEIVFDCIMSGERYDPSLDKLGRYHDPILFWRTHDMMVGTSVQKRNDIILTSMYRRILLTAINQGRMEDHRCNYDEPISAMLTAEEFGASSSLVIRHQPRLTTQAPQPVRVLVSAEEVEASRNLAVPDITPVSPLIDLSKTNIYNDEPLLPRRQFSDLHINTLLFGYQLDQKYPMTRYELAGRAIVFCFGAALIESQRFGLSRPAVAKAVQLVDGRLDMVAVQVNNCNVNDPNAPKNFVFLADNVPLYQARPYVENITEPAEMNVDAFRLLANFLLI